MSLGQYEMNMAFARTDYMLTTPKVIFGVEAVSKVGEEIKQLGGKRALIVTDKALRKVGLADKVAELLRTEGLENEIFDDISAEPTVESLRIAVDFTRNDKFDSLVGIGGGSVLDSAKTCAILATNPGDVKDYAATEERTQKRKVETKGLPMVLIPTTSGTGTESTGGIMIINGDYKTWIDSPYCFPDVAIVDPGLTLTLPPKLTAGTGMDALSHAVEGYMVVALANPWVESFALEAIRLIAQNLRTAYHDGKNLQARWKMSWAAHLGGWVAMYTAGPATLGHCLSEALGSKYRISHGIICGICLPYVMEFNLPAIIERLTSIASAMGEDTHGFRPRDAAFRSIKAVVELMKDVDLPISLKQYNAPREDIPKLADYIVKKRQHMYDLPRLNPRKLTIENVIQVMENMWEGKLEGS